jgi:predicted kinase
MIILMAGLPGTGKTTLARALAGHFHGTVLDKDIIRATLFPADEIEYSTEQDDFVLKIMLVTAEFILQKDSKRFVFLDGRTFSRRYQIEEVLKVTAQLQQQWRILECTCSEETARRRLTEQAASGEHLARNRNFQLYLEVKRRFEAITLPKTIIDTNQTAEQAAHAAIEAMQSAE